MDRKRAMDGNLHKIHEQYNILKKRFQDDASQDKKLRAMSSLRNGITLNFEKSKDKGYESLERSELRKNQLQRKTSNILGKNYNEKQVSSSYR